MNRIAVLLFAITLSFAFIVPTSGAPAAPPQPSQTLVIDRIEEGIAALCTEGGNCYLLPVSLLGGSPEAGMPVVLGPAVPQGQPSDRLNRLALKLGDLLDDM